LHRDFGGFCDRVERPHDFSCGDTAYFPGFKEIGDRFRVDLALLPIGAYEAPTGREVHMNPEEAVRAFLELRARTLIPMHYGTFPLGFERSTNRRSDCLQRHARTESSKRCS